MNECDKDSLLNNKCKNLFVHKDKFYYFVQKDKANPIHSSFLSEDVFFNNLTLSKRFPNTSLCLRDSKKKLGSYPFSSNKKKKEKSITYYTLTEYTNPLSNYLLNVKEETNIEEWYKYSKLNKLAYVLEGSLDVILILLGERNLCHKLDEEIEELEKNDETNSD